MQRAALDVHNSSSFKSFGFDQQIGYCLDREHPRVVVKVTDLWSTSLSREDPESHLKQRTTIL